MFQKNNKLIVFFNKRDIGSFMQGCCGQRTAIRNKGNREAMKKRKSVNYTTNS